MFGMKVQKVLVFLKAAAIGLFVAFGVPVFVMVLARWVKFLMHVFRLEQ